MIAGLEGGSISETSTVTLKKLSSALGVEIEYILEALVNGIVTQSLTDREINVYFGTKAKVTLNKVFRRYQFVDIDEFEAIHVQPNGEGEFANQIKVHQGKRGIHGIPNKKKLEE